MLEYETANPDQDRAKDEGEHFNPDLYTAHSRVSFVAEDYAAMEGRTHGHPKEYGAERRPFSDSPAPPHPNAQFAGLPNGGMHAGEMVKPIRSMGGDSDRTLASNSISAQTSCLLHRHRFPLKRCISQG
jgi:aquaporin related protein